MRLRASTPAQQRRVNVVQEVVWTNSGSEPTNELVFQVVANNKLSKEMIAAGERTVESMRLDPRHSIDKQGRRFHLTSATSGEQGVAWRFDRQHDTHLHLTLNKLVAPGESVQVALRYWIDIPNWYSIRRYILEALNGTGWLGRTPSAETLLGAGEVREIEERFRASNRELAAHTRLPLGDLGYPV